MRSSSREEVVEVFDALDAAMDHAVELSFEALTTPERLGLLERCETLRRRLPAVEHPLINQLAAHADATELGGKLCPGLANRLRISRGEAARRIAEATDLGQRQAITGEPLPPWLTATAEAQREEGASGPKRCGSSAGLFTGCPRPSTPKPASTPKRSWAALGGAHRPDELAKLAERLAVYLNPDGNFTDADRARRRGVVLGSQGIDGMSPISGYLTPEARASFDAVLAKLAATGMANPADPTPCVKGTPSQQAIEADTRSAAQRNHDALAALTRAALASGELGQHNGLPATVIVTTTLRELESGAGIAITGGGSLLPIKEVIRMASAAHHYLRIYDGATELGLYHTKRIASPGQRLILYAKDRGCSFPGCDVPGYLTEVHHVTDYAQCRATDINDLTQACGPHHKLITCGGWTTRKLKTGDTQWIPPAHLDHGQPRVNTYHHPEKLLLDSDDDP